MKRLLTVVALMLSLGTAGAQTSIIVDANGNVKNATPTNFPTGQLKVNNVVVGGGGGGGGGDVTSAETSVTDGTPVVYSGVDTIRKATPDEVWVYTDPGYDIVAGYNTTTNLPVPYRFSDDETMADNSATDISSQRATREYIASHVVPWGQLAFAGSDLINLATRNFSALQNKPTTVVGYGITDGLKTSDIGVTVQASADNLDVLSNPSYGLDDFGIGLLQWASAAQIRTYIGAGGSTTATVPKILGSATVDFNAIALTNIYTVPAGVNAVITNIIFHHFSATGTNARFTAGWDGLNITGATSIRFSHFGTIATTDQLSLSGFNVSLGTSMLKTPSPMGAAADVLKVNVSIAQGSALTALVDVVGYLVDATTGAPIANVYTP